MKKAFITFLLLVIVTGLFAQFPTESEQEIGKSFFTNLWQKFVLMQKELNSRLSKTMVQMEKQFSTGSMMLVLGIALLYGALHAIGPGHGKMLVGSYFLNSAGNIKSALKVGLTVAMTHNGVALVLALAFGLFLKAAGRADRLELQSDIQTASGIMIICVGCVYFVSGFPIVRRKIKKFAENRHDYMIGVLSGIVPCPVSLTVVLFSIYLNQLWLGLLTILCLSFGMAFTVSLFGILAIYFRGVLAKLSWHNVNADVISSILSFVGAFGITLAGILLLMAR